MLDTPRDFEALERLRVDTPNLAAGLRWLLGSDRVADVLGFFADAGWVDSGLVPFVLVDELGRVADEALRRHGAGQARGYVDALFYFGLRAFHIGDWDRYQHWWLPARGRPRFAVDGRTCASARPRSEQTSRLHRRSVSAAVGAGEDELTTATAVVHARPPRVGEMPVRSRAGPGPRRRSGRGRPPQPGHVGADLPAVPCSRVASLRSDPDRALAAAEECIRLDQTHRKAWSTLSEGSAATLRVDRGEVATGLRLLHDVLRRLHWSGELFYLSMQLPGLADSIAGSIRRSRSSSPPSPRAAPSCRFAVFDARAGSKGSPRVDELGPDAVEAARSRAASMSYDEAVGYIFDGIDRLITETAEP